MLKSEYKKRSFLKFDVPMEMDKLYADYKSIPPRHWASSYWGNVHCSVGMVLLRGGNTGTEEDFYSDYVCDNPLLSSLPYIRYLISGDGPFGGAKYAFIFRMMPNGITIAHKDLREQWYDMYRIHVPIVTNDDAVLVSGDKSIHFEPGSAWSFDNQSVHGVVNGATERVHLIFDVEFNDTIAACIDRAEFCAGYHDADHQRKIKSEDRAVASYPGDANLKQTINSLKSYGLSYQEIADFLNSKGIPSKTHGSVWTVQEVSRLLPAIMG